MEQFGEDLHLQFLVFSPGLLEWQDLEHILEHWSTSKDRKEALKERIPKDTMKKSTMNILTHRAFINTWVTFLPPPQEVRNVWVDIRLEPWKTCLGEMNITWTRTCNARNPRKLPCADDGNQVCMYCNQRVKGKGVYVVQNTQEKKDIVFFLAGCSKFNGTYASLALKK